jgi:hypothetical protein
MGFLGLGGDGAACCVCCACGAGGVDAAARGKGLGDCVMSFSIFLIATFMEMESS